MKLTNSFIPRNKARAARPTTYFYLFVAEFSGFFTAQNTAENQSATAIKLPD
jgi:hypothetical protein